MSLLRAHKAVYNIVRQALDSDTTTSHIRASVGARFQSEQNPEVIIQQSSFDINDLNTQDYGTFEISVYCYSNTYLEAAKIADLVFDAVQNNEQYTLTEEEPTGSGDDVTVFQTLYHIRGLDLFLEHYDEDGYEANVLIRVIESQETSGVGTPGTGGAPAPFYPQSTSRIQDLADVNVSSLAQGNVLTYDFATSKWVNSEVSTTLADLDDVDLGTASLVGKALVYDQTSQKWVPGQAGSVILEGNEIDVTQIGDYTVISIEPDLNVTTIQASGSAAFVGNVDVGGELRMFGATPRLIRPYNLGGTTGALTVQSNGDFIIELDENDNDANSSLIVKDGLNTEIFKVSESGEIVVNQQYTLPTTDGNANYFLKTDGNGQLFFATLNGTSGNTGASPAPPPTYELNDLTDVDTTTVAPTDGQALVWDNVNSKWEPGDVGIDGLSSAYVDTDIPQNWYADSSQIIGVGTHNPSGVKVAFGETGASDLFFKSDGTRLFVVGTTLDSIQSVDLPIAWDLSSISSTATVTTVNLAGSAAVGGRGLETALSNMHVANDPNDTATYGKKFFVVGDTHDEVQEYTCTTAWDLSTMSPNATAVFDLRTDHGSNVYSITFNPDGTIMYVGRAGSPNTFSHFDLSTAWDLSTAVYNSSKSATISVRSTSYGNFESYVTNIAFNGDGTKAYFVGRTRYDLHSTTLSTAWDLSTYTDDNIPLNLSGGYVEQAFGTLYPNWDQENFLWPIGLFNTDDYLYILFNTNDQIIRLDKRYYELDLEARVKNKAVFQRGLRSYGEVEVIGTIETSNFRTGGNAYFQGAMNWAGFNSGPGVTKNSTFFLGTSMGNLAFVNSGEPSNYANATSKDVNNTTAGTWVFPSDLTGANNIILPASSGVVMLDTDTHYISRYNTEAAASITGATEKIEYYYTARADGQGEKERFIHNLPAPGQTVARNIYYSSKAFAVPDTSADWTFSSSYSSYSDALNAAKALLNDRATGTLPLTTKIATTGLSTVNYLTLDSGSMTLGFSLRRLNPNYTGAAIRVINDSGVEADIGFVEEALDTSALLTHCGSGDGYLTVWYDQSQGGATGTGNDATYGNPYYTPTNRPKIVSAGTVLTDNGKPCVFVQNSSMRLPSQIDFTPTNGTLFAYVASKNASANNNQGMVFGDYQGVNNNPNYIWEHSTYIAGTVYNSATNFYFAAPENGTITGAGQHLVVFYRNPSSLWYMDRNSVTSGNTLNRNYSSSVETLFNGHSNIAYSYYGNVQEIIAFDSSKSNEMAAIKSNINSYYSIY